MFAFDATRLPKARTFRDPVHNLISWKSEGDVGRVIGKLIDAREVQRLRFVRQLGLASLVFHGAEHTRFTHSLGVAHVVVGGFAAFTAATSDKGDENAALWFIKCLVAGPPGLFELRQRLDR